MVGGRSDSYVYKIDRSGSIAIKDIGMLSLAGLSLESANTLINKVLKDNFIETKAVISLSKVRDIEILITGQVHQPGVYILSGYSSLLHAIIMAGGISEYGTLRKIKIKRPYSEDRIVELNRVQPALTAFTPSFASLFTKTGLAAYWKGRPVLGSSPVWIGWVLWLWLTLAKSIPNTKSKF